MPSVAELVRGHRLPPPAVRRSIREHAHLTLADLAALVGVNLHTIRRWELNLHEPTANNRRRYAAVLHELLDVLEGDAS